ncbi:Hypothetical predicted protein [Marmota monax]|uniref:Uncharacterized protein n=1 Tax=Marmota monax TaxID=9995 RepID=A0A5E4CUK5_MARMO|nr:hypothetical protein GHT09_011215 [Marmota monax]VTJ85496.1 Hypothetical predicted protein [Marmota monax]
MTSALGFVEQISHPWILKKYPLCEKEFISGRRQMMETESEIGSHGQLISLPKIFSSA